MTAVDQNTENVNEYPKASRRFSLRRWADLTYVRRLVSTPEGRAHVLSQLAEAESSGEAKIFEQVLGNVADPKLQRRIRRHQADEIRHAELFRGCLARTGVEVGPVPAELRIVERLDAALDGFLERRITDRRGVMEAYLILQVIEERAVQQMPLFVEAFQDRDPETSRILAGVVRDEARHLLYCQAIAKEYAPSEAERIATLGRLRLIEARVFKDNQTANLAHTLSRGYTGGLWARLFWSSLGTLARVLPGLPLTAFYREPSSPQLAVVA